MLHTTTPSPTFPIIWQFARWALPLNLRLQKLHCKLQLSLLASRTVMWFLYSSGCTGLGSLCFSLNLSIADILRLLQICSVDKMNSSFCGNFACVSMQYVRTNIEKFSTTSLGPHISLNQLFILFPTHNGQQHFHSSSHYRRLWFC